MALPLVYPGLSPLHSLLGRSQKWGKATRDILYIFAEQRKRNYCRDLKPLKNGLQDDTALHNGTQI